MPYHAMYKMHPVRTFEAEEARPVSETQPNPILHPGH